MAWTKAKMAIAVTAGVLLTAGTTTVVINQSHPSQARLAAAREHYEKAMKHYMAQEYEAELAELDLALGFNPDHAEALFSRACLYDYNLPMNQRRQARAVADYSRLIKVEPRNESARFNRAGCYYQLHQPDKAIVDYTMVIEGDVDFSHSGDGKDKQVALARHYRGRVYFDRKAFAKAAADFTEAMRLNPDIAKPEAGGRILLRRGQAYHALKRFAEAQDDYAAYAQIAPGYGELWQSWAWQLATCPDAQFRDGGKALEYALKANHPETLAAAYAELGQFDQAVKWQKRWVTMRHSAPKAEISSLQARLDLYKSKQPYREN